MKKHILFFLIILSFIAPIFALFRYFDRQYGLLFAIFLLVHTCLRVWETFFTSKEKERLTVGEDWTLIFVTFIYISLCYVVILEFYLNPRVTNLYVLGSGLFFYLVAFRLRWWGMAALGKQWAIHAVGEKKVIRTRIIRFGPFKYIRHPIYVATLIEQLGIVLIANSYFSLCYFFFVTIPAYFIRMTKEEKSNIKKFGNEYIEYKRVVGMMVPKFAGSRKLR
jgi:protein-S-isoprenylcysteine O-methyltransferase Ste14